MSQVVQNKDQLLNLLLKNKNLIIQYGVISLGIFGSFARNEPDSNSDVDIIVEFDPTKKTYKNFIGLAYFLEDILGRKVELVTQKSLSPYIAPYITKEVEYVPIAS